MTFRFDVDGTITPHSGLEELEWAPNAIERIESLLRAGHEVIFWTARGDRAFGGTEGPAFIAAVAFIRATFPQCRVEPKPWADFYVDDRAIQVGGPPYGVSLKWIADTYGV